MKKRTQIIDEVPYGMLVWQLPDGNFVRDQDGNFMHVFLWHTRVDLMNAAEAALEQAAKSYGFDEGKAVFWRGKRPVTDEELALQLQRAEEGLVPDPFDIAAIKEEERNLRKRNG